MTPLDQLRAENEALKDLLQKWMQRERERTRPKPEGWEPYWSPARTLNYLKDQHGRYVLWQGKVMTEYMNRKIKKAS